MKSLIILEVSIVLILVLVTLSEIPILVLESSKTWNSLIILQLIPAGRTYDNKSFTIENLFQQECPIKYAYGFIENYLSPLYTDIKNFIEEESFSYENLEVIFSADPVKKFISNITNGLVSILKLYADGRNTITYNEYFKVLSDFEIFPDLVTRTKMIKIFINFINDFDKEFIIKSNNKVFLSIDKCAYAILFIALGSGENTNIKIWMKLSWIH